MAPPPSNPAPVNLAGIGGLLDVPASLEWARPSSTERQVVLAGYHLDPGGLVDPGGVTWTWSTGSGASRAIGDWYFPNIGDTDLPLSPKGGRDRIDEVIDALVDDLPWTVAESWRQAVDQRRDDISPRAGWRLFERWVLLTTIVERKLAHPPVLSSQLAPLYRRALFLLLSVPFREGADDIANALTAEDRGGADLGLLARSARTARRTWAHVLEEATDLEFFEHLDPVELDDEIDLIAWDVPVPVPVPVRGERAGERRLLVLQPASLCATRVKAQDRSGDAEGGGDQAVGARAQSGFHRWYARRLLLPRFRLVDAHRVLREAPVVISGADKPGVAVVGGVNSRGRRVRTGELARRLGRSVADSPVPSLVWMAVLVFWTVLSFNPSIDGPLSVMDDGLWSPWRVAVVVVAMVPYGEILLGLWLGAGAAVTYPLALRLPAVAVLGASVLMALGTGWYAEDHWLLVIVVVGFSVGYVRFEAANHRVSHPLRRSLGVLALGYGHGFTVAVLWFAAGRDVFLSPIECPANPELAVCTGRARDWVAPAEVLSDPSVVLSDLCLTAAVGVMLGLAIQILWDDRPVTYPLTHLGGS